MSHKKSVTKSKLALQALTKTAKDHALKLIIAGITCAVNILTGGEAMAEKIGNFFSTYGLAGSVIIILVMVLTQLLKWPIKKAAIKWAEKNGLPEESKKRITQWVALIPFVLSFLFSFLYVIWFQAHWDVNAIDWFDVGKFTVSYASVAIATFDIIKGFVDGYTLKKNENLIPTETTKQVKEVEANPVDEAEAQRIKDENERQAREAKEEEARKKEEARLAKIKAKKVAKYLKLKNEIDKLGLNPEDLPPIDEVDIPEEEEVEVPDEEPIPEEVVEAEEVNPEEK